MARKLQERNVLLAHPVKDADRTIVPAREANDLASRSSQFALQRDNVLDRCPEVLLKKLLENVHEGEFSRLCLLLSKSGRTAILARAFTAFPNESIASMRRG